MSIFKSVSGFFTGAISSVIDAAKDAWGAIKTVWAFLVQVAHLVDEAWNWVVNGVKWFGENIQGWAALVYNGFRHVLFTVIPNAIQWAISEAVRYTVKAVDDLTSWVKGRFTEVLRWAGNELRKLSNLLKGLLGNVISWVKGPIEWVLKTGRKIESLVLHPEVLVKWILGSLVVPLIKWLLTSSLPVLVWLAKSLLAREREVASLLEEFLAKVI